MAMNAATLCLEVCVFDIRNMAGTSGTNNSTLILLLHWQRVNQHGCALRSSNSKQKPLLFHKYFQHHHGGCFLLARTVRECLTIHSLPAFCFLFF